LSQTIIEHYGSILIFLLLWVVVSYGGIASNDIIPSISQVGGYLYRGAISGIIFSHIIASLGRSLSGFLTALLLGIPLGILMARIQFLDRLSSPLMATTYPIPKVALLPLLILWLGIGFKSKFCLIIIGCIYPIIMNTYQGVKMVDKFWIWSAQSMGATKLGLITRVIFPASLPYIFVGARISLAISFLILFGAEMIGTQHGLGSLIINAMEEHRPDIIFAAAFCIAGLGFSFDRLLLSVRMRLLLWRKEEFIPS
jgi:ABC-type nitrate/sulfonate/bicarbonate transport system permease component